MMGVAWVRGLLLWPGGKVTLTMMTATTCRGGSPVGIHHKILERGMQKLLGENKRESKNNSQ